MSKKRDKSDTLTPQQEHAARLRVLDGEILEKVAAEVGVARDTIWRWQQLPAWVAYVESLRAEMHDATIATHKAVVTKGGRLRARLLDEVARIIETQSEGAVRVVKTTDGTEVEIAGGLGVDEIGKLAAAVDRLTTSAEDRAGYPKTTAVEHSGEVRTVTGAESLPDSVLFGLDEESEPAVH